MNFPVDYYERVYAGVLGKIIGVYLGRPVEGWTFEKIAAAFGEIHSFVNRQLGLPLVVADDDISGTFTFLRALEDYQYNLSLTPAQIGQTWLNYIIENRTILWWGGLGNSTEHTAYLRLKDGVAAPSSGCMALNGKVVSEQIGAQIFIDGWGMATPGNPSLAVDLARRAASVSHDGEAIYAAQVVAALISQAFVETNIDRLIDRAVSFIPPDSIVYHLITDLRAWHAADPVDWRYARAKLAEKYGYDKYGGNCHVIPNHGLIILSLLYSQGDFSRGQMIVNTCGWDTDCNAGNLGAILGVLNGLKAFDGSIDWRSSIADRLYLPTADGGRAVSDALHETDAIMKAAYGIVGEHWTAPKDGARFHFSLPGAVQGFEWSGSVWLSNEQVSANLVSAWIGQRALALHYQFRETDEGMALTPTFIPLTDMNQPGYSLAASPAVYSGQVIRAILSAGSANNTVTAALCLQYCGPDDRVADLVGPLKTLSPEESCHLDWEIPALGGAPILKAGIKLIGSTGEQGIVYLHSLTWEGAPEIQFHRQPKGKVWRQQWVNAVDSCDDEWSGADALRLVQNRGRGLLITGTRQWHAYQVQAQITPHLAQSFGLAVCVQGLERYYALLLTARRSVMLIRKLDGETILAEAPLTWEYGQSYCLRVSFTSGRLKAWVDEVLMFEVNESTLEGGGIALICEEGRVAAGNICISGIR